jgi:hypothetical protein
MSIGIFSDTTFAAGAVDLTQIEKFDEKIQKNTLNVTMD